MIVMMGMPELLRLLGIHFQFGLVVGLAVGWVATAVVSEAGGCNGG